MAGVGRRGFAAAARAAMFAAPNGRPMGPSYMGAPPPGPPGQYPMRRPNAPQYLDINADARCKQFNVIKLVSATDGYPLIMCVN